MQESKDRGGGRRGSRRIRATTTTIIITHKNKNTNKKNKKKIDIVKLSIFCYVTSIFKIQFLYLKANFFPRSRILF